MSVAASNCVTLASVVDLSTPRQRHAVPAALLTWRSVLDSDICTETTNFSGYLADIVVLMSCE